MEWAKHKVAVLCQKMRKRSHGCNSRCVHGLSLEESQETGAADDLIASLETRSYFSLCIQYMLFILGMSKHGTMLLTQKFF